MRTQPSPASTPLRASEGGAGRPASALSHATDARAAAADLIAQFEAQLRGASPTAIIVFNSPALHGPVVLAALGERYPAAQVVGCTTAGEFIERDGSVGGVSAMALPASPARAAHAVVADFRGGVERGIRDAATRLGRLVGADLATLDAKRYVGIVLFDGLHMREEAANEALGAVAPQLAFVGGSAGDDLAFKETRVFHGSESSADGAVLLLLEMAVPFTFTKSCSFEPTRHRFTITRADEANRVVYELDGRPVLDVYAEVVSATPATLGPEIFMTHPVGMMLDGEAWIRSPQQALPDGGLKFYCRITEGSEIHVMRSTDLVGETRDAMTRAVREVGGRASGAILFNCILRRLELDATKAHEGFRDALLGIPTVGFHTYGETYVGHVNQTCTGIVFA